MKSERWLELATDGLPRWKRSMCVIGDEVFLAAALFGDERVQLMKVLFDGVQAVQSEGHLYIPLSWIVTEYPEVKDTLAPSAKKAVEIASQKEGIED